MGGKEKEFLPHGATVNEYFERLDPDELQKVQQKRKPNNCNRRETYPDAPNWYTSSHTKSSSD